VNASPKITTRADTEAMDAADPIAHLRDRFILPEGDIYLDGNSLGALPHGVMERLETAVKQEWGHGLIRSWNDADWYPAPQRAGAAISRLIGADTDEVIVCDSISVNLYKLLVGALRMRPDRKVIVSEIGNFPTDVYINAEVAKTMGCELRCVMPEEVEQAIADAGDTLTQDYKPHPTIDQMLTGTASQLATLALEAALKVFEGVDMNVLRQKNMALGDLFIALVEQELGGMGFELASPKDAERRGSQVSLTHENGYAIMQAVIARGVVGDFRAPDILRFGFAAPYVRYVDMWDAVRHIREVMETEEWKRPEFNERRAVT